MKKSTRAGSGAPNKLKATVHSADVAEGLDRLQVAINSVRLVAEALREADSDHSILSSFDVIRSGAARAALTRAKADISEAAGSLDGLFIGVENPLFAAWDLVAVAVHNMHMGRPPSGESVTHCPTLTVLRTALRDLEAIQGRVLERVSATRRHAA